MVCFKYIIVQTLHIIIIIIIIMTTMTMMIIKTTIMHCNAKYWVIFGPKLSVILRDPDYWGRLPNDNCTYYFMYVLCIFIVYYLLKMNAESLCFKLTDELT
jgi:hypothetical protein